VIQQQTDEFHKALAGGSLDQRPLQSADSSLGSLIAQVLEAVVLFVLDTREQRRQSIWPKSKIKNT